MNTLEKLSRELPALARRAIDAHLAGDHPISAAREGAPAAGVFVTLREADGKLRGCIGSITPAERDVFAETARSAVLAATRDPRFSPVGRAELAALSIEVSVLAPDEPVAGLRDLDPKRYGVIVCDHGGRRGLLLPDIEGVDDAETQVAIARQKAGIAAGEPVRLSRFRVTKAKESSPAA